MDNLDNELTIEDSGMLSPELPEEQRAEASLQWLADVSDTFCKFSTQELKNYKEDNPTVNPNLVFGTFKEQNMWYLRDIDEFQFPLIRSAVAQTREFLNGFRIQVSDSNPGPDYLIDIVKQSIFNQNTVVNINNVKVKLFLDQLDRTKEYLKKQRIGDSPRIIVIKPRT